MGDSTEPHEEESTSTQTTQGPDSSPQSPFTHLFTKYLLILAGAGSGKRSGQTAESQLILRVPLNSPREMVDDE